MYLGNINKFVLQQQPGSLIAYNVPTDADVCLRRGYHNVAVLWNHNEIKTSSVDTVIGTNGVQGFILAHSISIPQNPFEYNRKWGSSCNIPKGDRMIDADPVDARMPFDETPISYSSENVVSACVKISGQGKVEQFYFTPSSLDSRAFDSKIVEEVARKCWKFNNLSGTAGWIQVGLDRRIEGNDI